MKSYPTTARNRVIRNPKRAHYDEATVHAILDAGFICHVGFVHEGQTVVIPITYGRLGNTLYLHGALNNRMLNSLNADTGACVTVTHLDGLVLARSVFHHSVNYRSVVLFGQGRLVTEATEKAQAFQAITDQILPGRWEESRQPNEQETKITTVIAFEISEASAKVRTGPPKDEPADEDPAVWAGVVPLRTQVLEPVADEICAPNLAIPQSLQRLQSESSD